MKFRKKTTATLLIAIFMISTCAILPTFAVTEEEIEDAIELGIDWLASCQWVGDPDHPFDGGWGHPTEGYRTAMTGLALIKLQDRAYELGYESPFDEDYEHSEKIITGWEYIFTWCTDQSLTLQDHTLGASGTLDDPDSDGDGVGAYFWIKDTWYSTYTTGIVIMALESSGTPGRPSGVDFDGDDLPDSFFDVAQDAADWLAWGQSDSGFREGGWHYGPLDNAEGMPDNSNGGYAVLGLAAAEGMGCTVPEWVKTELNAYINYIQNDEGTEDDGGGYYPDGGSGYQIPDYWVNSLKTGNLIFQMTFVGDDASTTRFQYAMDYIVRHWQEIGGGQWDTGWGYNTDPAHYQAMYCLMKGFEYSGIDLIDLDGDTVPEYDWYDELAQVLVDQQSDNGYWTGDAWGNDIQDTCWALLTLEKVTPPPPKITVNIDIKPGSWPNPINKGSKGVFSAAICGTDEFDVMTIDPETVNIYFAGVSNGVPPLRWSYEDVATPYTGEPGGGHVLEGDDYMDLVLHFDTQEVVEALELCNYDDETVPLIVRGKLLEEHEGSAFEGQDYVWLKVSKGKGPSKPTGNTIQIGMTSASTDGMENTEILAYQIIEPKINEYVSELGLDITFEFIVKNNEDDAGIALENTQYFKSIGIDLIIGHGWSGQCAASLDYVNENDMLLLSHSSTYPLLAIADDRLFRTCPNDNVQAPAIAEMWETWGAEAVLIFHRADSWGDGIYNILTDELADRGIDELGQIRYPGETWDFTDYLAVVNDIITNATATYGADRVGIQFISFNELRTIQNQASIYPSLMDIIWMGTENNGRDESMLEEAGEWAVQTRHFSSHMAVDEDSFLYQDFADMYYDLTGLMTGFYTASQYDAAWLLVETILKTASTDPGVIAEALIPTSHMMHGISGWMALDENGDRIPQTFNIWGFYEKPETNDYTFGKFGTYDAQAIEVYWDDGFLEYTGITRPGKP